MLLKLEKLIAKYGMKITGVIQAGAHEGEELELFKRLGIKRGYFFEPCGSPHRILMAACYDNKVDFRSYCSGLSDFNGCVGINTTKSNNGQSNSADVFLGNYEYGQTFKKIGGLNVTGGLYFSETNSNSDYL